MIVNVLHSSDLLLHIYKLTKLCFSTKFLCDCKKKSILVICVIGMSLTAHVYVKQKVYAFFCINVFVRVYVYPLGVTQRIFSFFVLYSSRNPNVLGIFLNNPLPRIFSRNDVYNCIPVEKDVDGLGSCYTVRNLYDKSTIVPCTAAGVFSLLKRMKYCVVGKNIVILNISNTVGMPLLREFLRKRSVVTILEHFDINVTQAILMNADVVVTAIGVPGVIKSSWFKIGAVIVDIGISKNITEDRVYGDVTYNGNILQNVVVPRSVGRATLAYVLFNTMLLYKKCCVDIKK